MQFLVHTPVSTAAFSCLNPVKFWLTLDQVYFKVKLFCRGRTFLGLLFADMCSTLGVEDLECVERLGIFLI